MCGTAAALWTAAGCRLHTAAAPQTRASCVGLLLLRWGKLLRWLLLLRLEIWLLIQLLLLGLGQVAHMSAVPMVAVPMTKALGRPEGSVL